LPSPALSTVRPARSIFEASAPQHPCALAEPAQNARWILWAVGDWGLMTDNCRSKAEVPAGGIAASPAMNDPCFSKRTHFAPRCPMPDRQPISRRSECGAHLTDEERDISKQTHLMENCTQSSLAQALMFDRKVSVDRALNVVVSVRGFAGTDKMGLGRDVFSGSYGDDSQNRALIRAPSASAGSSVGLVARAPGCEWSTNTRKTYETGSYCRAMPPGLATGDTKYGVRRESATPGMTLYEIR
jgi:hypothetical protein